MKILKWVVLVLVGLALLTVAVVFVRNKSVGPAGWARDNTLKQLRANLRNPASMVIRSSYIVKTAVPGKDASILALCGVVDAKNPDGAYTGGLRFVSRSLDDNAAGTFDTGAVHIEDPARQLAADSAHVPSDFDARQWNAHCVDAAHPPLLPLPLPLPAS